MTGDKDNWNGMISQFAPEFEATQSRQTPARLQIKLVSHKASRRAKPECSPLENEARFRTFFGRSADPMSLLDPQTLRYIEANEAVAKLFGATNREALRDVSPTERWPTVSRTDGSLSRRRWK